MKDQLSHAALAAGESLHLIGVSLDDDIEAGLAFLGSTADFDQLVVGGGMKRNTAALRYLIEGPRGYLGIPQVVVHEQVLRLNQRRIEIAADHELARYMGADHIAVWVESGAPLPPRRWHAGAAPVT